MPILRPQRSAIESLKPVPNLDCPPVHRSKEILFRLDSGEVLHFLGLSRADYPTFPHTVAVFSQNAPLPRNAHHQEQLEADRAALATTRCAVLLEEAAQDARERFACSSSQVAELTFQSGEPVHGTLVLIFNRTGRTVVYPELVTS